MADRPRRSSRSRIRRPVAALLATAVLALGVGPASSQPDSLRAEEGNWVGRVSFVGNGIPFSGSFEFVSAGGTVDGEFGWAGGGAALGGTISGPDTMPVFTLTNGTSNGIVLPDVTGGGEIEFLRATCERLEGTGVNIAGPMSVANIDWWAVREGAVEDPTAFFAALEALQTEVNLLIDDVTAGRVIIGDVFGDLEIAITQAEAAAAAMDRTVGCGLEFYRSIIAAEVSQLLDFVLANPDINAFDFANRFNVLHTCYRLDLYD